jgi:hypothetical protein
MAGVDNRIRQIEDRIGNRPVRVLLVEGDDDMDAMGQFLRRRFPDQESQWSIQDAGGKRNVLKILRIKSDWVGLVDRDEWTPQEISQYVDEYQNLEVLPRFCLESYLIDPVELWSAFPEAQKARIAGGVDEVKNEITRCKPNWLRHAALWHTMTPLRQQLRQAGFIEDVIDTQNIPDDERLEGLLDTWQNTLAKSTILESFRSLHSRLQNLSDNAEVFSCWIYAKAFYPQVVHPLLNRLLGQKPEKQRKQEIFRTLPIPDDPNPLWRKMGLSAVST